MLAFVQRLWDRITGRPIGRRYLVEGFGEFFLVEADSVRVALAPVSPPHAERMWLYWMRSDVFWKVAEAKETTLEVA